ncbi:MAG: type II toxin-antitoxin system HicA family toxin [Betaproteobacteria bacterium]|nr:type II toxin-antitoxin system HicA family toxin [Betaproteobacteria bacterium]
MNSKHRKTLAGIFAVPTKGTLEWARIEALLVAIGCEVQEGKGSAVTFRKDGLSLFVHRPHPGKESLHYRVERARDFLEQLNLMQELDT